MYIDIHFHAHIQRHNVPNEIGDKHTHHPYGIVYVCMAFAVKNLTFKKKNEL